MLLVLWPMPLYGSGYIFSKKFFTGWVAVGITWIFCSFAAVGLYPAWESRHTLLRVVRLLVTGQTSRPDVEGESSRQNLSESGSGDATPVAKTGFVSKVG